MRDDGRLVLPDALDQLGWRVGLGFPIDAPVLRRQPDVEGAGVAQDQNRGGNLGNLGSLVCSPYGGAIFIFPFSR